MKTKILPLIALFFLAASPSFAVSKEIIQLQTQVQGLQDQMARMQQSFDERMGVMRDLVQQNTDSMNKITAALGNLQQALNQQHADATGHTEQVSGQIQALNDSVDELKARLAKISTQLDQIAQAQQNLPAAGAPATPGAATQPQSQAPPPQVLYDNALRDYNAGKYDLANSEFSDFIKYYPTDDLAGNAQFYLADIEYRGGNFQQAVQDYDKVLEQYPGGNKTAAAQLKKGLALIQLGQKQDGTRELQSLIQRYPRSIEATTAREQLRKMGAAGTRASKPSAAKKRSTE